MDFCTMYRQLGGIYIKATRRAWPETMLVKAEIVTAMSGEMVYVYILEAEQDGEIVESTFTPSQLDIDSSDWEWVIG